MVREFGISFGATAWSKFLIPAKMIDMRKVSATSTNCGMNFSLFFLKKAVRG